MYTKFPIQFITSLYSTQLKPSSKKIQPTHFHIHITKSIHLVLPLEESRNGGLQ